MLITANTSFKQKPLPEMIKKQKYDQDRGQNSTRPLVITSEI